MKHDWQSVEMPEAIAELPRDSRGFPITFVTLIEPDGRPDFTTVNGEKIARCIREALCGLCGKCFYDDETNIVAFIGGPMSMESGQFLDPPMHVECAEYAFQVCPHIAIDTSRYAKPKEGGGRVVNPHFDPERPEKFGIFLTYTSGYQVALVGDTAVFIARPITTPKWSVPISLVQLREEA